MLLGCSLGVMDRNRGQAHDDDGVVGATTTKVFLGELGMAGEAQWRQGQSSRGSWCQAQGCAQAAVAAAGRDTLTALAWLHRADILRGSKLEIELN